MQMLKAMGKGIGIAVIIFIVFLILLTLYATLIRQEPEPAPKPATIEGPNWALISDGRKLLNDMIKRPEIYLENKNQEQKVAFNQIIEIYNEKEFMDNEKREELLYHSIAASTFNQDTDYKMALKAFRDNEERVNNDNN